MSAASSHLSPLQEGLYFQAGYAGSSEQQQWCGTSTRHSSRWTSGTPSMSTGWLRPPETLQRRNPTLRAGFVSEGLNEPVQFFSAGLDVPVVVHDLRELDDSVARERAEAVRRPRPSDAIRPDRAAAVAYEWCCICPAARIVW